MATPESSSTNTASTKRTLSSSTCSDHCYRLTKEMKKQYDATFRHLNDKKKWCLGDNVSVEDLIYQYGLICEYEHAAHSFILDEDDTYWKDVFTPEQLDIVKSTGETELPDYDSSCKEIFTSLSNTVKTTTDKIKQESSTSKSPFMMGRIESVKAATPDSTNIPDLLLSRDSVEYGVVRHIQGIGVEVMLKSPLHLPKMMKSIFLHTAEECCYEKDVTRSFRII
ncbi:hypothetical protein BDA99DRAFT_531900 [Phascolomyces articulosus]|uniref:Uncharacterized protein n=1 Tax=Phascolomyces articulosus TaxID=60185 RepID=A0AAD5KP57_9FUNG|nr:hypothetical protein BDA99DRAFT_531900 [Phascolomyces articulosus]